MDFNAAGARQRRAKAACTPSARGSPRRHRPHATGLVTAELLERHLPADRDVDVYFLGPKPFMQAAYRSGLALGVAQERLR